jgi:hypothetical protein
MSRASAIAILITAGACTTTGDRRPTGGDAVPGLSGDHALVMGGETVKRIENAPLAGKTVDRRYTNVWRREGGAWRLFARQATVTPVSP